MPEPKRGRRPLPNGHAKKSYVGFNCTSCQKKRIERAARQAPVAPFVRDTVLKNIP